MFSEKKNRLLLKYTVFKNDLKRGSPKILKQNYTIQGSPFITLYLGSTELERVISEPCYKGIILYRNNRKMTILEPRPDHVITQTVL